MTNEERIAGLTKLLSKNGWFDSVGINTFGKMVVFVHYINSEVMQSVPDKYEDKYVVTQFTTTRSEVLKAKYNTTYTPEYYYAPSVTAVVNIPQHIEINQVPNEDKELDVNFLISELDRLEKICGSRTLQDIFYEVHDGKNAVTNLKTSFPEVYDDILDLYEEFGFDIIYNELDG
jgi:hypothetical protein